jgi:hypothetical protein
MKNPPSQATIAPQTDGAASPAEHAALTPLVDELVDLYVSWREECAAVAASYENWSASDRPGRRLAFSAYLAALNREELAAATYRSLTERIAEVHGGGSAVVQRPARDERSDPASLTRRGLRRIARKSRPRGA